METTDLVERVALAIERADRQRWVPDGYADGIDHEAISDWGVFLARAAIAAYDSALQARVEKLGGGAEAVQGPRG